MSHTRVLLGGLSVISLLWLPSSAQALTASVRSVEQAKHCDRIDCATAMTVQVDIADPAGESNDLSVAVNRDTASGAASLVIVDRLRPVTVGAGCTAQADGTARCPLPEDRFGNPRVYYSAGGSVYDLGGGDDVMRVGRLNCHADQVRGGTGNDMIVSDATNTSCAAVWNGGPGADVASALGTIVSYADRTAAVTVTAGDGSDDGEPGEGDDVGVGVSSIQGGSGNDSLDGHGTVSQLIGGDGDDSLRRADNQEGGAGDDRLSDGVNLSGGPGKDRIEVEAGESNLLFGGPGNDMIRGGSGRDYISGGTGRDRLYGGAGNDNLDSEGAAVLDGGPGDDSFTSSYPHGRQEFVGGAGKDRWWSNRSQPTVWVSLDGRANDGPRGQRDNLLSIEDVSAAQGTLVGSSRADVLELTGAGGVIDGRGGDDVIIGRGLLRGGRGHDRITVPIPGPRRSFLNSSRIDAADGARDRIRCYTGFLTSDRALRLRSLRHDRQDVIVNCVARRR